ncbi:MAG: GNAT family N-acetyltransferase [Egibacteraceae bacterium]
MRTDLNIMPLSAVQPDALVELAKQGHPFIRPRGESDYWLYGRLFSSTCKVAMLDDRPVGFIVAFRDQDHPEELYIQDLVIYQEARRQGIATALLEAVLSSAKALGCERAWLTSELENDAAHRTWCRNGFTNPPADRKVGELWVTDDLKGPGKHRVIYEYSIS